MTRMGTAIARPLVAGALLVGAACGGNAPAEAETPLGTYTLASAEGAGLPAVVFDSHVDDGAAGFHFRAEAEQGTLTLAAGGRYTHHVRHSRSYDGRMDAPLNLTDRGTWTVAGTSLHLSSEAVQNLEYDGTISNGTVTLTHDYLGEGRTAEYRFVR